MRVISLLPGATDTIVALGCGGSLVGVSAACDPGVALPAVRRVTRAAIDPDADPAAIDRAVRDAAAAGRALHALDATAFAELQPDLIVTQALCDVCAVSEHDVRALAATLASRPRVLTLGASTIEGILTEISTLADAIGASGEGEELVHGLKRRMRFVHDRLKAARAPRPRVAVIEWTDPLFNAGHWVPEQVRRAGGVDVTGSPGNESRRITADDVVAAGADLVIVAPCGLPLDRAVAEARLLLQRVPALAERAVWALDANALTSMPGRRIVDGIEAMARIFAPALFSALPPTTARRVAPG